MSFFNELSKLGTKAYKFVKHGVQSAYSTGGDILRKAVGAKDWVNHKLEQLSNLPYIGEYAKKIQESEALKKIEGGVDKASQAYNELGKIGDVYNKAESIITGD